MDWHSIFSQALQQGLGPVAAVYCLAAIGLNVHFGYTGLLNFGQAGFMAVGGYAVSSFVATWGLSRTTNLLETSLPMLTRGLTCTQNCPGGPVTVLVQPDPTNSPRWARKLALSK